MKSSGKVALVALLLAGSAFAQNNQQINSPGIQTPRSRKPNSGAQQQAMPALQHSMEDMEIRTPESTASNGTAVQEPEKPSQQTGSNIPVPDLLESAKKAPAMRLSDFEALATKNNPTLKQAQSLVRGSAALARQAGLWPNPSAGYQGDEISGGSFRGGEQGAFLQQNFVLGGKLQRRRNVYEQQRRADEIGVEEQKLDVRGAVQMYFYSALTRLRRVEIQRELLSVALDAATTSHQLANVGQADAPDVLQAEAEAEQVKIEFVRAQGEYMQAFEELAAVAGAPDIPVTLLEGDLETPPVVDTEKYLHDLILNSPTLKRAEQNAARAEAALARDKREAVPDLLLKGGLQQNLELNEFTGKPVGLQGFATASIQIPIFNRNQGNVEASQSNVQNAQQEVERVRLQLLRTAQPLLQQYLTSKLDAERYSEQIIPRAQRAYELYLQKYRNMAAAYPMVLVSQRTLFQMKDAYIRTLGQLWIASVQLQNCLLADGLSAPTPSGSMNTQVNLPTSDTGGTD
ncbi:MAG TPA: TolC family protein [Terriglobales bacterium]